MAVKKSTTPKKSTSKSAGTTARKPRSGSNHRKGKKGKFSAPLLAAFFAGILMAAVCYFGITAALQSDPSPSAVIQKTPSASDVTKRTDTKKESTKTDSRGKETSSSTGRDSSRPNILPPVGNASKNTNAPVLGDVQAALAELQEMPSTDQITPFIENLQLVDFALAQTRRALRVPESNVHTQPPKASVTEGAGGKPLHFSIQRFALLTESSAFTKELSRALDEWAPRASLTPSPVQVNGASIWDVRIDGALTHSLVFYAGKQQFPGKNAVDLPSAGIWPDRGKPPIGQEALPEGTISGQPAIVVVIDDLGASKEALDRLLRLDFPITCAFWPFAAHTESGAKEAYKRGMEILIHMPMEPVGYPTQKPGPEALFRRMGTPEITRLVHEAITKVPHATGLNNHMGSRFTQSAEKTAVVVDVLKKTGLFCLDSVTHSQSVFYRQAGQAGVLRYRRDVFLDVQNSRAAVLAALARAERIALSQGYAVAIGHPLSGTLDALEEWQKTRNPTIRIVRLKDL